jgi:putative two-component system response regulator
MDRVQKGRRVLIVDDTQGNIEILTETLRDEFIVLSAMDGVQALSQATAEPVPDLILLDVTMPGMDGYEVCRRLKENRKTQDIPVIFVTALADGDGEARGFSLGAVDFVAKPFRPSLVKARVRAHVELKCYRDSLESVVAEQTREIAEGHMVTIFALSKLAESRDDDTGQHLERVQRYCRLLAQRLLEAGSFSEVIDAAYVENIFWATPLHDVGKVAIPDAILCKPGKLTPDEFEIMKTHTTHGAATLNSVLERYPRNAFLHMGRDIALAHHEKWDGSGYPQGLAGSAIPLAARIMAFADVYDALTSERCYKPAFPHERSRDIILEGVGTHFDPDIARVFSAVEGEFRAIRAERE